MSAAASLVWTVPPGRLATNIARLGARFEAATARLYGEVAIEGQAFAQVNARWTNRTGQARATLHGTSEGQGLGGVMAIAHGMDYGVWLELANQGVWGIIPEALQHMGTVLQAGLSGLLAEAGRGIA